MESTTNNNMSFMPPPGVRQALSGASDGGVNRQASGRMLRSRRDPTGSCQERTDPHPATAELESSRTRGRAIGRVTGSALPAIQQSTTPGVGNRRMKWSNDLNLFIMRTYYQITNNETNTLGYRRELHRRFAAEYPQLNVTEQRVADQRRTIVVNNLIPRVTLERMRQDIATQLAPGHQSVMSAQRNVEEISTTLASSCAGEEQPFLQDDIESIEVRFRNTLFRFSDAYPDTTYPIPRLKWSKKLSHVIQILNSKIVSKFLRDHQSFIETHKLIYCAAVTAAEFCGRQIRQVPECSRTDKMKPWERRITGKIEALRRDLGRLTAYLKGSRSCKLSKQVKDIMSRHRTHTIRDQNNKVIEEYIDTVRQKLNVLTTRYRRYRKSIRRKDDNKLFTSNEKMFYRKLKENKDKYDDEPPDANHFHAFWSSLWSNEVGYNTSSPWLERIRSMASHVVPMDFEAINVLDIRSAIKNSANWRAPGPDNTHNFWLKKLTCVHEKLAEQFTLLILGKLEIPDFLTKGVTYLKPKDSKLSDPSRYQPITCLNTIYKLLTTCLKNKIQSHMNANNIISIQQKGWSTGSYGCKEQLIIDSVILEQVKHKNRNLYAAFIDYYKAFDSVPHSWLIDILKIYKVSPVLTSFLSSLMKQWQTVLTVNCKQKVVRTLPISIKRGIFQGDSLSPMWFCIALNPLSELLNSAGYGIDLKYERSSQSKVSHLMYIDDIKLYASSKQHLGHLIDITKSFSNDLKMEFGQDKCRTQRITRGKLTNDDDDDAEGNLFPAISEKEGYKYLGFYQKRGLQHKELKEAVLEDYERRLKSLTQSQLNGKNLAKAINTYAMSALSYSFGIVRWSKTDLEAIDRKLRTMLTKYGKHHHSASKARVHLPRQDGGRGFMRAIDVHDKQVVSLRKYFWDKAANSELHLAVVQADVNYTPLNLERHNDINIVANENRILKEEWLSKVIHARHPSFLEAPHVDKNASNTWLVKGNLYAETESFMVSIQDEVIKTANYKKYILKEEGTEDNCRMCHSHSETIQHITSSCKMLVGSDYKERHDNVAKVIHSRLAVMYGLLPSDVPYYAYDPNSVLEKDGNRLYWDRTLLTERNILHNRPDITLLCESRRVAYLIEIGIPGSHNLLQVEEEKRAKYQSLANELKELWNLEKVHVVPIIISVTGLIHKNLGSSLAMLNLPNSVLELLQKAVILGTCHTVRKFLGSCE